MLTRREQLAAALNTTADRRRAEGGPTAERIALRNLASALTEDGAAHLRRLMR